MGPRSIDRGNQAAAAKTALGQMLQWGRDQLIAEMPSGPGTLVQPRTGFNGAAIN
jgi:hypothetical protein